MLNQRYVCQRDPDTGRENRLLRLAMGSHSQLCPVAPGFKLIVIVQQTCAYEKLDLPLLNRFEKQVISPMDILDSKMKDVAQSLNVWCEEVCKETGLQVPILSISLHLSTTLSPCLSPTLWPV